MASRGLGAPPDKLSVSGSVFMERPSKSTAIEAGEYQGGFPGAEWMRPSPWNIRSISRAAGVASELLRQLRLMDSTMRPVAVAAESGARPAASWN